MIPDGDEKTLVSVAKRYTAIFIILDQNHPRGLEELYTTPADRGSIKYLGTYENARIYTIG